ncbi:MAG: FAD:protein FMN transferase [Eubacteriales bacterium]|nr:FAD:protein FMN transferase [Eubacteriales bacterium]
MKRWKMAGLLLAAVAAAGLLWGCGTKKASLTAYDKQYLEYFDTITSVTIYAESQEQFDRWEELLQEKLEYYHRLFDIYNTYDGMNNVKTINDQAGLSPVKVDRELLELLELSVKEYEETDGAFDVAMGSVLSIWHDYREAASENGRAAVPAQEELLTAAEHMDINRMVIDRQASTVYLEDPDMSLDVGAVAKGYAGKRLGEILRQEGVTSALISLGGNVVTIGTKADGEPWRVGVQNPDTSAARPYVHVVDLTDMCLVTSGTYQRYYEVDGVRYHHIINPETLMPWDEYQSVTILTPDSAVADALSTAVFNMELEKGMALIESLDNTEALWILADGSERESSGFQKYMEE